VRITSQITFKQNNATFEADHTRIQEYLAKKAEFKGKKLRDLDVGPVIDFVREVLDYKSGMRPFTEPIQKLMTLEEKY
jgi:hypothetical protein